LRADQWCAANCVCIAEFDTGGSVISVPPKPSEVAPKFAAVYCPSRVSVSTAAPLLTVSVPLALAPEVSCDQESLVVPLVKARPRGGDARGAAGNKMLVLGDELKTHFGPNKNDAQINSWTEGTDGKPHLSLSGMLACGRHQSRH
jgi:hypothetical protein